MTDFDRSSLCADSLLNLVNSLIYKINRLEEKVNLLESNYIMHSHSYNISTEVNDNNAYRNIVYDFSCNVPPVRRQNAFIVDDELNIN